jgi:hypothetical protein
MILFISYMFLNMRCEIISMIGMQGSYNWDITRVLLCNKIGELVN